MDAKSAINGDVFFHFRWVFRKDRLKEKSDVSFMASPSGNKCYRSAPLLAVETFAIALPDRDVSPSTTAPPLHSISHFGV